MIIPLQVRFENGICFPLRGFTEKDVKYQQKGDYKNKCLELRDEILNWYGLLDIAEGDGDNLLRQIINDQLMTKWHRY